MVEAMGGAKGKPYEMFKQTCVETYLRLRKSSHLVINLFTLMLDAQFAQIKRKELLEVSGGFPFLFFFLVEKI